jgi:hypothetical protein
MLELSNMSVRTHIIALVGLILPAPSMLIACAANNGRGTAPPHADSAIPRTPLAPLPATQAVRPGPRVWTCADDKYEVFAAVLRHRYILNKDRRTVIDQVVLGRRTIDCRVFNGDPSVPEAEDEFLGQYVLGSPSQSRRAPPELDETFARVNRRPAEIDPARLRVEGLEVFIIEQGWYNWPERPDHRGTYASYPRSHGISLFSRVAFSKDGRFAAVSLSTMEGQFGYGTIFLLRRGESGWRVEESQLVWIT